jgi:cell pole-organizing protein PopZ
MNKPAAKEPSMDEILSSIRQIIADDDESAAPRRPSLQVAPDPMEALLAGGASDEDDSEPLALSSAQIVPANEAVADMGFEALLADAQAETAAVEETPALVVPDDVGFSFPEPEASIAELPSFDPAPRLVEMPEAAAEPDVLPEPEVEAASVLSAVRIEENTPAAEAPVAYSRPTLAAASPMPDQNLSADIAEGLLETTTKAAIRGSIDKLGAAGIGVVASPGLGNANLTIETMVREMLRPILKEWLDENLPAVVERMVEKEISRVARGD